MLFCHLSSSRTRQSSCKQTSSASRTRSYANRRTPSPTRMSAAPPPATALPAIRFCLFVSLPNASFVLFLTARRDDRSSLMPTLRALRSSGVSPRGRTRVFRTAETISGPSKERERRKRTLFATLVVGIHLRVLCFASGDLPPLLLAFDHWKARLAVDEDADGTGSFAACAQETRVIRDVRVGTCEACGQRSFRPKT